MKIEVLNNSLSPALLVHGKQKILINTPKGVFSNVSCKIDAVILTGADKYHTYELQKIKNYKSKEIIDCIIFKDFEMYLKGHFPKIGEMLNFREIIEMEEVAGIKIFSAQNRGYKTMGLKIEEDFILPVSDEIPKFVLNSLRNNSRIYISLKRIKETERQDFMSLEKLRNIIGSKNFGGIGILGSSRLIKEEFKDNIMEIKKSLGKNKILDKKKFLYLCKEFISMKNQYKLQASFKYVTSVKSEEQKNDFFVVGYASVPVKDRHDELITEDALKKAADGLLKPANNTLFLNHNYDRPIGKIIESKYTKGGLLIKAIVTETEPKIRQQIKEGLWTSLSIGGIIHAFEEIPDEKTGEKNLHITDIEIVEVSLVGVPANAEANLIEVVAKSLDKNLKKSKKEEENVKKKQIQKSIVAYQDLPLTERDMEWDGTQAESRVRAWAGGPEKEKIDWKKYRKAFTWYDSEDQENFGSYKLQVADIVDGSLKAVPRAVFAIAAVLNGARGGVSISDEEKQAVYNHIVKYYEKMDEEPPELKLSVEEETLTKKKSEEKEKSESKKENKEEVDEENNLDEEIEEEKVEDITSDLDGAVETLAELLDVEEEKIWDFISEITKKDEKMTDKGTKEKDEIKSNEIENLKDEIEKLNQRVDELTQKKAEESEKSNEVKKEIEEKNKETKQAKERKGTVEPEEDKVDEEELLKQIADMTPKEIMDNKKIWDSLDEEIKKAITNQYFRTL